jgi:hypothetical protein
MSWDGRHVSIVGAESAVERRDRSDKIEMRMTDGMQSLLEMSIVEL